MSLSRADIDLMAEKRELDAFLSKCLEIEVREDAPRLSSQESITEPSGSIAGERFDIPIPPEPVVKLESAEIPGSLAGEIPSVQAGDFAPAESLVERAAAPLESAPVEDIAKGPEFKPQAHAEEVQTSSNMEQEAQPLQSGLEVSQIHFGPGDEFDNKLPKAADDDVAEQPKAVPLITDAQLDTTPDKKPDLQQARPEFKPEIPIELRSPYLPHKSSLRKPSKNAGAMAYTRESEKKKKRMLVAVGIFVAFLIGVAAYLYMFPNMGDRSMEIISGKPSATSSQEQEKVKAANSKADSKPEESKQIHKKITRGGT